MKRVLFAFWVLLAAALALGAAWGDAPRDLGSIGAERQRAEAAFSAAQAAAERCDRAAYERAVAQVRAADERFFWLIEGIEATEAVLREEAFRLTEVLRAHYAARNTLRDTQPGSARLQDLLQEIDLKERELRGVEMAVQVYVARRHEARDVAYGPIRALIESLPRFPEACTPPGPGAEAPPPEPPPEPPTPDPRVAEARERHGAAHDAAETASALCDREGYQAATAAMRGEQGAMAQLLAEFLQIEAALMSDPKEAGALAQAIANRRAAQAALRRFAAPPPPLQAGCGVQGLRLERVIHDQGRSGTTDGTLVHDWSGTITILAVLEQVAPGQWAGKGRYDYNHPSQTRSTQGGGPESVEGTRTFDVTGTLRGARLEVICPPGIELTHRAGDYVKTYEAPLSEDWRRFEVDLALPAAQSQRDASESTTPAPGTYSQVTRRIVTVSEPLTRADARAAVAALAAE